MKAVILAAGEGKRMRPFTHDKPKVMLPVGNKPFLEFQINALARNGVRDIIIVVGYCKERIMSYFGNGKNWKVRIQYVIQEKQFGTAHALKSAENHLLEEENFLLLSGDNIIEEEDLMGIVESPAKEALLITDSQLSTKYGVVEPHKNQVSSIREKTIRSKEGQIFTGIALFTPKIFDYMDDNIFDLVPLLKKRLKTSPILSHHAKKWMDAVYPQDLQRINSRVLEDLPAGYGGIVEPGVSFKGHVRVAQGSTLRAHSYFNGPVTIGEGTTIGQSTSVNGSTSIGNNTTIGPFCDIKNSIIFDNVTIDMGSKLENVVVGSGTHLGARFTSRTAGYPGIERSGIAIGEDCIIHENVILENGLVIGNNVRIEPNKHIKRPVGDRMIAI